MSTHIKRRDPFAAAALGAIAPVGYFYAGGSRYAALVAVPYAVLIILGPFTKTENSSYLILIALSLLMALCWKCANLCMFRNAELQRGVSQETINSWDYACRAMLDLAFGWVMTASTALALVGATGLALLLGFTPKADTAALVVVLYLALAPLVVWATELAAGFVVVRASAILFDGPNPFLADQERRWLSTIRKADEPGSVTHQAHGFRPTWSEAKRAVLLPPTFIATMLLGSL